MRTSEWIVAGYFAYLSIAALRPRLDAARRARVWGAAAVIGAGIGVLADVRQSDLILFGRDWLPGVYVAAGYYVTGFFVDQPKPAQEEWLKKWDARLLPARPFAVPLALRMYLELVYNGCLLLLPAGLAVLVWQGLGHLADHYWTVVVTAEFAAFASLPWFQTRPPWMAEDLESRPELALQQVNLYWLRQTSVCMNTFPSGHAAGSVAVALAVMPWAPGAGAALLIVALSIAFASVVGRYHYALDAVTGIALGCAAWAAWQFARF